MIAYLDPPQHGAHVAYNEDEVARCLADGWALRTTSAQPVVHDPEPQAQESGDGGVMVNQPRKRGRPRKG